MKRVLMIANTLGDKLHSLACSVRKTSLKKHHFRMTVGVVIMYAGVFISQLGHIFHELPFWLYVTTDVIGYGIHGLGTVPFVMILSRSFHLET